MSFLLGAAILAGGFYWRSRHASKLIDRDTVVLADFKNITGDPVFDDTLKQAISVQLGQSPFLNILSDARTRATLRLMAKPPGTQVTPDVARDSRQRAGAKAYVAGTIGSLGSQYVIGLDAVNCKTGDLLVQEQVTAENKEHVLRALGETRSDSGRNWGSPSTPLKSLTFPWTKRPRLLEALKALSLSMGRTTLQEQGSAAAIPFFNHAARTRPQFRRRLCGLDLYSNLREPGRATENLRKAYDLRDKVSERERLRISANYYLLAMINSKKQFRHTRSGREPTLAASLSGI